MTDCRPVSLFSLQTGRRLGEELGINLDKRRFRANVFMDLASTGGFAEDGFVGRMLRIGSKTVVSILERDPRCAIITLDPDTAERNPAILSKVTKAHEGKAGVYGADFMQRERGSAFLHGDAADEKPARRRPDALLQNERHAAVKILHPSSWQDPQISVTRIKSLISASSMLNLPG